MTPTRTRRYTAEFKAEVALAALIERWPLAELAAHYQTGYYPNHMLEAATAPSSRLGFCRSARFRCSGAGCGVPLRRYRPAADGERAAKKNAGAMSVFQQRVLAVQGDGWHLVQACC
ncbi:hypothetical protein [Hymenobacter siberiensis]|jgi:hypothetical protein|uniref:hypothetical protein n=1 Tax=Hymenobacter siberiensis TaxID=2848396 RepID=UPI001C1E040E|nr:hypothetical protein [Hymenobacter siberiensis]